MIEKKDFRFRDDLITKEDEEEGKTVPIEILTGPYKNVIFRYVKVGVKEKDGGEAVLQYIYDLLEMAENTETALRKDQRFTNHLGILLNHLILETAQGIDNATRENDTQESAKE